MKKLKDAEWTRNGLLRVRLSEREEQSAKDIALRKNRLFRRHGLPQLPVGDTIVALAFAKALGDLFPFISHHLYDKMVWTHPDDPTWIWNARRAWKHDAGIGMNEGGSLLFHLSAPVALGQLVQNTVTFSSFLPAPWRPQAFQKYRDTLIVPNKHLKPIGELTDALQDRQENAQGG